MKIHVRSVDPATGRVEFQSDVGAANAAWRGELPEAGRDYHVELAVDERLVWGTDIVPTGGMAHHIAQDGAAVTLDATLESIDDDGAGALRLGPSLVLIDTEGTPPQAGAPVRARLLGLALADTGI